MREHAKKVFPHECCGVVLERDGRQIVKACRNVQDKRREEDPTGYERTARTAYYIDHEDIKDIMFRLIDREGYEMLAIYHSHPNTEAYFSPTDRDNALWDNGNEPLFPGVSYIVMSVFPEGVRDIKAFGWDENVRDFVEIGHVGI
jgi:proteasome lid subunit RPN8/RPN11